MIEAYLVLIGDLWKVLLPRGTVFGGSWELGPSIGEWENLLVAPDDGKGQKLMEPYHAEHDINNLQKLTQKIVHKENISL